MTFDMRDVTTGANPGPRKITLGGNLYFPGHNLTAIFRGGLWDCGNKTFLYSDIYKAPSNVVHVTDGAVLANLASFSGGSYGDRTGGDAYVYVDGSSRVYTKVASLSRYVGKAGIKLPENFLKRWLYSINKEKFTMEDIEKDVCGGRRGYGSLRYRHGLCFKGGMEQ